LTSQKPEVLFVDFPGRTVISPARGNDPGSRWLLVAQAVPLELIAPARGIEVQPALPDTWAPAVSATPANTTNFFVMNFSPTRSQALLATVLVVSVAANIAIQAFGLSLYLSAAFGLIAVASGITLFSNYRKNRGNPRN
jgi:hypothetical protein